ETVGIEKRRRRPPDDALVFPERHRGDVAAIFPLIELGLDPDLLQILGDELSPVDVCRLAEAVEVDHGREALRVAGLREEPTGFGRIVLVVLRALAELLDRQ